MAFAHWRCLCPPIQHQWCSFSSPVESEVFRQNTIKALLILKSWAVWSLVALSHLNASPWGTKGIRVGRHASISGEKHYCMKYYLGDQKLYHLPLFFSELAIRLWIVGKVIRKGLSLSTLILTVGYFSCAFLCLPFSQNCSRDIAPPGTFWWWKILFV